MHQHTFFWTSLLNGTALISELVIGKILFLEASEIFKIQMFQTPFEMIKSRDHSWKLPCAKKLGI